MYLGELMPSIKTDNTETDELIERRGKPRLECAFPAVVRQYGPGMRQFQEQATLINLSANGLYLQMKRPVEPGQELFVLARFCNAEHSELPATLLAIRGPVIRSDSRPGGMCGIAVKLNQHRFL